MHRSTTIRNFSGGLLLLVFFLAITPKRLLHHCIISHKAQQETCSNGTAEWQQGGYHCDCDEVVASAPFAFTENKIDLSYYCHNLDFQIPGLPKHVSCSLAITTLRGPPNIG